VDEARTRAAARFLAGRLQLARAHAVSRGVIVGLRFTGSGAAATFTGYRDGDEDGVRTGDIATGVDTEVEPAARLSDLFPGVTSTIAFGTSTIVSFTPSGTASSGSVFLEGRDGSRYAVRVLGATARTRVLRFDERRQDYVEIP
jgi:Tfp pilus assembly protein FimT